MRKMSIRVRLTIWYSGVLALVLLVFGTVIYFTMRHQMLTRIDHGLGEELSDVLSEVERADSLTGMIQWLERRFGKHQGFDFQITAADGTRVFSNERLGRQVMPIRRSLVLDEDVYESHLQTDASRWRMVTREVDGPDGTLVVQIARSLEFHDHEMSELLVVLLVTGPLTLLVALGGGYLLARRALAPVDRMTETANRIEAAQLGSRLEVANPDDELGRLAATLNGMLDRLETSFREMQRFTADASHELRTPIAVIRTEAEVALTRSVDDEKKNVLSSILEECERLTWITDQLLTLSRDDAGMTQYASDRIDLSSLVAAVVETMTPLAQAKHQSLTFRGSNSTSVNGDAGRLRQVFYNLLDNAIKFTPREGQIEVTVARCDDAVNATVRDTGIGIPGEHLPRVFDRFYRVDKSRSRNEGGTGLGLSIIQTIVVAHGGSVDIKSQPECGTTCMVTLPSCDTG